LEVFQRRLPTRLFYEHRRRLFPSLEPMSSLYASIYHSACPRAPHNSGGIGINPLTATGGIWGAASMHRAKEPR
jgi:hypothetical protein